MPVYQFKLDENLGQSCSHILAQHGHDVRTVVEEDLAGAYDHALINACRNENRCLLTLDLDFSNPLVFDPRQHSGIVVLRLPPHPRQSILSKRSILSQLPCSGKVQSNSCG